MNLRSRLQWVALCALTCALAAAGDYPPLGAPKPPKAAFYLITDYLPVAIYDRDSIAGSFRIENTTGTEAKLEFVVTAWDGAGKVIAERTETVAAPPSGFGQCQGTQEAGECAKIEFAVRKGQEKVGAVTLRQLRDDAHLGRIVEGHHRQARRRH
ncbi:MAG: hypothetical protein NTW87_19940, partial [Planctomycetota bacterium]|nr:hypothetical protein [Planctomycetota bacterium]